MMSSGDAQAEVEDLRRELAEARAEQSATADILAAIGNPGTPLESTLVLLIRSALALCGGERGVIWIREGGHLVLGAHVGYPAEWVEHALSHPVIPDRESPTVTGRVAALAEVSNVADLPNDPRFSSYSAHRLGDYRGSLAAPLMRGGSVLGVIGLTRPRPGLFTDRQVGLIRRFADQAVIAIHNARLIDEVKSRTADLQEALDVQTALSDVLGVISRSPSDLMPVLDAIARTAARICVARDAHIYMLDGDAYRLASSTSPPDDPWQRHVSAIAIAPDMRGSATARAARLLRTIHVPDTSSDPEHDEGIFRHQTPRTVISVPLVRDGVAVGVITLNRETINPFTPRQIDLLTAFADQAVIAVSNTRMFEEVQARTRDLAMSLEELRTAQDRLVQTEKLASLGQLTAGIAHEIKNPLNFINNFSALSAELVDELRELLSGIPFEEGLRGELEEIAGLLKGNLEKVTSHGRRADSIVRNMLLHSRTGSGDRRQVDVNALVDESLSLAYHGARAETPGFNVTLRRDLDPSAGHAMLLPQEITRVLLNLLGNGFYAVRKRAEQAGPGYEPSVSVSSSGTGETIEIRVWDNGAGISEDVRQKMFDPFYTTKPAGEGTGLGLSLSHDIVVKQHEGRIAVATEPGSFTEFTIQLPRGGISGSKASPA
ncbi:MAG: GAF domain-containing protein [Alsobacter sp.]